ncbi:hypothetical protein OKW43_002041 [Paraburkholderia sp. WC7.3g]
MYEPFSNGRSIESCGALTPWRTADPRDEAARA